MALPKELFDVRTGERKYLNLEERKAFFQATLLEEVKVKYISQLIYYTGCRLGEALQASPDRFDYSQKGIILRTLKQGKDKNGKEIVRHRFNELPDSYLNEIQGIFGILKAQGTKKGQLPLFEFTDRTARTYVKQVMAKAGVTGGKATPRGLRHSMGVMLALKKVPANTIKDVLGHKAIKNTMIYLEIMEDERRGLVSQIW
jgi:integrase/recombinase XerD